ncbi:PKD domain-containing protein [Paenibacillus sp. YN15]|uniref:PKD domain-containing protein n=1 Tax=Paenibacillus sp. YN15 TaxID=1742774 RepID=UPI000DCD3A87|nr:PKD domain-containing protein [Paenibacillus sp. YN15]RAU93677.1 hypothetical protein DQG13_25130 [Paenibacillus sp. YN15]
MKKFWSVFLIFSILYPTLFEIASYAATIISPSGPANIQTITKDVKGYEVANPGVYWYQSGGNPPGYRYWVADLTGGGHVNSDNVVRNGKSYPNNAKVSDSIDLYTWRADVYTDPETNEKYKDSLGQLASSPVIDGMPTKVEDSYAYKLESIGPVEGSKVHLTTITGVDYQEDYDPVEYEIGYDGYPMYKILYTTHLNVNWKATIQESKEIDVLSNSTINIGGAYQATAQVKTKNFGSSNWSEWVDVSSRTAEIVWSSNNTSVATVNNVGKVTGVATGNAVIAATWKKGLYELRDTITITVGSATPSPGTPTPTPTPTPPAGGDLTGDIKVQKDPLTWKDFNTFELTVNTNGCKPTEFLWQVYQNNGVREYWSGWKPWSSDNQWKITSSYMYDPSIKAYWGGLISGPTKVSAGVKDSCGGISWIGPKDFVIGDPPANRPPEFEIGWFKDNDYYSYIPITEAVVGDTLNVRVIERDNPKSPYDPDDDLMTFEWRFAESSSEWIRGFPGQGYLKGEFRLTWINAAVAGKHEIQARMCDTNGACTERTATITIQRPEPLPCINVPSRVVQNRPLAPNAINGDCSRAALGRTISKYFWTNKLDVYPNVGPETITLEVEDNKGVRNLPENKAVKQIFVQEDKPPIPNTDLPTVSLRGNVGFNDLSVSPDGDIIIRTSAWYQYDSDNDGNFDEHPLISIPITVAGSAHIPTAKVGKYRLKLEVEEDWGLRGEGYFIVDVKNLAPFGSFSLSSLNPDPPRFNTTVENEILMAFGNNWLGSSLVNPSLHKTKDLRFTYNTFTKGFTTNYARNVQNGPSSNFSTVFSQVQTPYAVYNNAPSPQALPTLFNGQFTGDSSKVGVKGSIPAVINGVSQLYSCGATGEINAANPGNCVAYDAKGGAYSFTATTSGYSSDSSSSESQSWSIMRTAPSGQVTWQLNGSYYYYSYDSDSDEYDEYIVEGIRYADRLASLILNDDATKIGYVVSSQWTGSGYVYTYKWYDVETGQEVDPNSVSLPSNMNSGAIFEDTESVVWRLSSFRGKCDGDCNPSNYYTDYSGYGTEGIRAYNKLTGETKDYYLYVDQYFDNRDKWTESCGINDSGSSYTYRDYREVQYSVGPDGTIYAVDSHSKIYVFDKFGNKKYEYTTLSSYPKYTERCESSEIEKRTFSITSGIGTDGKFYALLREDWNHYQRYYQWGNMEVRYLHNLTNWSYYTISGSVNPVPYASLEVGQILKDSTDIADADYVYDFLQTTLNYNANAPSGLNLRAQNHNNMYRVEQTSNRVALTKIVNGVRTEIQAAPLNLGPLQFAHMTVSTRGGRIKVMYGSVPLIDAYDSTFEHGAYGFFMGNYGSHFRNVYVNVPIVDNNKISDIGLVKENLIYATAYSDSEGDSNLKELDSWTYVHTNPWKFLDAGDGNTGVSAYNNVTVRGDPVIALDKVGQYSITYKAADEPSPPEYYYPDGTFAAYRAESDPYTTNVLIHRKPKGVLNVNQDQYYRLSFDDQSYDPDRWLPGGYCSTEATGIDYCSTRGITDRRYNMTYPDGTTVDGLISRISQEGMYVFRVAVRDEYGAWSDWAETYIWLDSPPLNNPPFVSMVSPNSQNEQVPAGADNNPTFVFNAVDYDENSIIKSYTYKILNYTGVYEYDPTVGYYRTVWKWRDMYGLSGTVNVNSPSDGNTVSLSRQVTLTLSAGTTYKFEVYVTDEKGAVSSTAFTYFSKGYPPSVVLTAPAGTQDNPTPLTGVLMPSWTQSDPDPNTYFTSWSYRVLNADGSQTTIPYGTTGYNDAIYYGSFRSGCWTDSEGYTDCSSYSTRQTSWTASEGLSIARLPQGVPLQVQVKVNSCTASYGDSCDSGTSKASDWSNVGWFTTNRPPTASMSSPAGSQWAPTVFDTTRPTFVWTQSDPDPGTLFFYFQIQITNEENTITLLDSGQYWQNTWATTGSWQASSDLPAGQKLRVRVRVFDGHVWSDWSAQTWFYINRPPVADFDWAPKPVWEGDSIRLTSLSYDPDGDNLTYRWRISGPDGREWSGSAGEWTGVWLEPGIYTVILTVSDGLQEASAEKPVEVLPLTIDADIHHTPDWLQIHVERGHETSHAPKDFYAGEKLLLHIASAPAPVGRAEARLEATGIGGGSILVETVLAAENTACLFAGELYDPVMGSLDNRLPDGLHEVRFRLTYSNGVVKETVVSFRIIGSALGAVGVHRIQ